MMETKRRMTNMFYVYGTGHDEKEDIVPFWSHSAMESCILTTLNLHARLITIVIMVDGNCKVPVYNKRRPEDVGIYCWDYGYIC